MSSSNYLPEHNPSPTPSRAVYGFVFYLLGVFTLFLYFFWALVPDQWLQTSGLSSIFPQKYWAVAVPIYLGVVFFVFIFVIYPSLGLLVTPETDDVRNVVDEDARYIDPHTSSSEVGDISPTELLKTNYNKKKK